MLKRLAITMCVLVALVAIGCGGSDSGSDSAGTTSTTTTEPVTLTVWDWGVPDPKAQKVIDQMYMDEHPNVTIKRVNHPFATYQTLLRSAIAARKGPDLFLSYASPFIQDFEGGIQPVNDMVRPEDKEKLGGWDYITDPDGNVLGVPMSGGGTQFYYNKALYRKAGLDPEAPPATWDDLLAQCDKLKAAGVTPISGGWKDGYYAEWWLGQLAHQYQSDEEINDAVNNADWNSPAIGKTFDLLHQLYERGCFTANSAAVPLFPNVIDDFKAGKAAIMLGLPALDIHWGAFRDTKWGKKDLGTFLAPLVPDSLWDEPRMNFAPSHALAITKWAEHPDVAYDYASFNASAAVQDKMFDLIGALSNNSDSQISSDDPVAQQIIDWSKDAQPYAGQFLLVRAPVETLLVKFVPDLVTGKKTYDDVADQVVAEHERATSR